jgi:hypothetical protein
MHDELSAVNRTLAIICELTAACENPVNPRPTPAPRRHSRASGASSGRVGGFNFRIGGRYRMESGQHVLATSTSPFDPERTCQSRYRISASQG